MKCKVCGRELKGKGNICKNCYNEKQKQKALDKDTNLIYEIKSAYKPGYEMLKIIDFLVIGLIVILSVATYQKIWLDIIVSIVLIALLVAWLTYRRNKVAQKSLSFYDTKIVYKASNEKEKTLLYKDLNDLGYYQNWKQKAAKVGDIRLMPANSIVVMQGISMPDVDNIMEEFENVKDIVRERINVEVKE